MRDRRVEVAKRETCRQLPCQLLTILTWWASIIVYDETTIIPCCLRQVSKLSVKTCLCGQGALAVSGWLSALIERVSKNQRENQPVWGKVFLLSVAGCLRRVFKTQRENLSPWASVSVAGCLRRVSKISVKTPLRGQGALAVSGWLSSLIEQASKRSA